MFKYARKIIVLLCMACIAFCGCSDKEDVRTSDWSTNPPPAQKITETNKIREEYGIRQIKETWTFYGREFAAEKWKDERGYQCKRVHYDENRQTILYEQDCYYTGHTYPSPDVDAGTTWEFLSIVFDYTHKRFSTIPTTDNKEVISLLDPLEDRVTKFGYIGKTNEETLEIAEKILKMWGLKRL